MRHNRIVWPQLVQDGTDRGRNLDVALLSLSADVVGFPGCPFRQHPSDRGAMIIDKQPVTYVLPIPIYRNRLAAYGMQNHQRYQLFRKLVRAVVIGTMCGKRGQAVGMVVGADQVIGSGLRRGVRAIGGVSCGLREGRITGPERAIHLIGRDLEKAEHCLFLVSQSIPIRTGFFQQAERAVYVGANEILGSVNRSIDMAFSSEVNDSARLVISKKIAHEFSVADV